MSRSVYVVHSNPVEGREDEYNDWYNNQHIPDVLAVPGFVAAQRFKVDDIPRNASAPHRYLALYEIEGDSSAALAALGEAVAGGMHMSDAMDRSPEKGTKAYLYTPVADRVTVEDIQLSQP